MVKYTSLIVLACLLSTAYAPPTRMGNDWCSQFKDSDNGSESGSGNTKNQNPVETSNYVPNINLKAPINAKVDSSNLVKRDTKSNKVPNTPPQQYNPLDVGAAGNIIIKEKINNCKDSRVLLQRFIAGDASTLTATDTMRSDQSENKIVKSSKQDVETIMSTTATAAPAAGGK